MTNAEIGDHPNRPLRAFFLDSENGAARLLEGMELLTRSDLVVVFHRGSFPLEVKNRLELASCAVEWVKCVDPGIKNSMDVQIIAELSMRLATDGFKAAYVLSEDKGYLPAVHYLQQVQQGKGRDIALVKNVMHAASRTVLFALTALGAAEGIGDFENALAPLFGACEIRGIVGRLEKVLAEDVDGEGGSAAGKIEEEPAALAPENGRASFVDLPGIGRALAGKLEGADVTNPEELARIGAVGAWTRIYRTDASFPPKWVYSFEAAIEGVPVHAIDPETKRRLKGDIKAFLSGKDRAA